MGGLEAIRLQSSVTDIRTPKFWRAVIAEFVGALIFLFVGVGGIRFMGVALGTSVSLHIALVVGLTLATVIWICADVSGGHINPAVSLACLVTRRISLIKFVLYVLAQVLGAIVGVALLKALSPDEVKSNLACTLVSNKITAGQGFFIELIITFMLVMTVFAACDSARHDLKGSAPLAIGLSVLVGHLFALNYTGASMNPARSIGSAAVQGEWANHWVYWVGPLLGGAIAGLLYEFIFAANTSRRRITSWLKEAEYDPHATSSMTLHVNDRQKADEPIPMA